MFVPQFYDFRAKRGERGLAVDNAEGGNRVGEFGLERLEEMAN